MEEGYLKSEQCNREGCEGVIDEHDKEGGCSCHINPPCSYCTTSAEYCPTCGWGGREEQLENDRKTAETYKSMNHSYVSPKIKTINDLDKTKIDWIYESHTHFSMIKRGVFPLGTTRQEVFEKVKGTFGGRFKRFDEENGRFDFIAYTD